MSESSIKNINGSEVSTHIIDETSLEFTRENIESLEKVIRLVDTDESAGLSLFCYIHCEPSDSDIRKQCRGVVFNEDKMVMKGFPYTIEYTEMNNGEDIDNNITSVFDRCSFYESYEGSLIRMFNFRGVWYLSTNRKLNAFKSKWASKESFGSFFKKALEHEFLTNDRLNTAVIYDPLSDDPIQKFQSILDVNKQYMFLLLNNSENRIVCSSPPNPTIYHVGTFIDFELNMDDDVYLRRPKRHDFNNIDELHDYVRHVDYRYSQGVIVFAPNNYQYKIFNQDYYDLYKVRGNEPSIKFRYLQVRMNKKYRDTLLELYPEFAESFDMYEKYIYDIANEITKAYVERFIKKNYVTVPVEEFLVIKDCHNWHLADRQVNKISLNKVIDVLNTQPPTNINRMIRKRIMEKNALDRLPVPLLPRPNV